MAVLPRSSVANARAALTEQLEDAGVSINSRSRLIRCWDNTSSEWLLLSQAALDKFAAGPAVEVSFDETRPRSPPGQTSSATAVSVEHCQSPYTRTAHTNDRALLWQEVRRVAAGVDENSLASLASVLDECNAYGVSHSFAFVHAVRCCLLDQALLAQLLQLFSRHARALIEDTRQNHSSNNTACSSATSTAIGSTSYG